MKQYCKKIVCLLLCLPFAAAVACKGGGEQEEPYVNPRRQIVTESDNYLVRDGESDYAVLLRPDYTAAELYAAQELNYFLDIASGVSLPVVTEAESGETRYISIGATDMATAAGVTATHEDLTRNGFRIVSYGDGIVIVAPNDSGHIYGVYRFLEENCDYMYYAPDEFVIEQGTDIPLKHFDYEDYPDFLNRDVYNYDTKEFPENAMRLYTTGSNYSAWSAKYGEGGWWSTLHDQSLALQIVDYTVYRADYPRWYCGGEGGSPATNPQICYTTALYDRDRYEKGDWSEENYNDGRHGMFWTFVYNLINNYIAVETDKSFFQLGMSDNPTFCTCETCTTDVAKYTRSGVSLRFVNAVADEVEKWRQENCPEREIYLTMFAYLSIVDPPVKVENGQYVPIDDTVVARDNVVIRYAPINDYYMYPLMDGAHNPNARRALLGWSAVASHFAVWDYRVNFAELIQPFPQWMSAYENIKTYYDLGFIDVFHQGCRTFGGTSFIAMDNWVRSRLLWDVHQDYDALVDEFFDVYYEAASDSMRAYMNYLTMHYLTHMGDNGYKGDSHQFTITAENYPRGFIRNVEEIFAEAYAAIAPVEQSDPERYAVLKQRVDGESLFYRYVQIDLYGHFYDDTELSNMIDEFERIAGAVRFLGLQTTGSTVEEIVAEWRAGL